VLEEQAKKVPQGEKDNEKMEAVLLIPLLSSYSLDPSLVSNTRITVPFKEAVAILVFVRENWRAAS